MAKTKAFLFCCGKYRVRILADNHDQASKKAVKKILADHDEGCIKLAEFCRVKEISPGTWKGLEHFRYSLLERYMKPYLTEPDNVKTDTR